MSAADFLVFEDRPSDSRFVERIWRSYSTRSGTFVSVAASHCEMVITRHREKIRVTLRGPETKATLADCPADGEWLGIRFSLGSFLPHYPAAMLRDRQDVDLPTACRTFWLAGTAWEYPDFENAEGFVSRLVRAGMVARDPAVSAALRGDWTASARSAQRHFRHATGLTQDAHRQIERARHAANQLRAGASIQDTIDQAGYFDQAHLTRSLRRLIGETPARIRRQERQLSLLYKNPPSHSANLVPADASRAQAGR